MDIGDIETDETERHEYDSYHDRVDDDDDPDVGESEARDTYLIDELEEESDTPYEYNEKSHISHELEWEWWEWSKWVESETDEHTIVVACLTMESTIRIEHEHLPWESEPIHESSVHTILLRKTQICIDNCSIYESVVGSPGLEMELRYSVKCTIKYFWGSLFDPRGTVDRWSAIVYNIISWLPLLDELWYPLYWVLPIGIDRDDGISTSVLQSCGDSELLAEVPR